MTLGTVERNILHRLGDAVAAFSKGLPSPAQLNPPSQSTQGGFLTFPGWGYLEQSSASGGRDEQRARTAITSPWVFADIAAIANEFSAAELIVKERQGARLEDVDNHPLELLWEAPNPHMGRSFLMKYWAWSYTLVGKAFLYWLPAGGEIRELWPIPPFMIQPIPGQQEFISGYRFKATPSSTPIDIPAEYVTYSHSVNLFDLRDGMSFLVAAMTGIESDLAMEAWNRNFFQEQNGVPDGLITVNKDTLDNQLATIRLELRDFFGGTRRGVAVARAGEMDYKPFGRSQKEVEFKEGIELASKVIGRTLGFPDGYWSETANRANAEQARRTMIAGAVWPLLVALHEDMNAGPVRRWWGAQYRAEFKDIRPEDKELKLKEQESRKTHWLINELREEDGKDPLDDPRGLMLVAEITKGTPLPATPAAEETEAYLEEQEAAVAEEAPADEQEIAPEAETPAVEAAPEAAPVEEMPAKALDLARWERKALKRLKDRGSGAAPFESAAIPADEQERIRGLLARAQTPGAVKAAFVKAASKRVTVASLAKDADVLKRAKQLREEVRHG